MPLIPFSLSFAPWSPVGLVEDIRTPRQDRSDFFITSHEFLGDSAYSENDIQDMRVYQKDTIA
jgi:hypothetical protein